VRTAEFGGVPLWRGTLDRAVATVLDDALERRATAFRLVNAYSLYCAATQPRYAAVLRGAGINFMDGRPLARVMARRNRSRRVEQVRGPTLFERCLADGRARGCRHFLLGSSPALLADLHAALLDALPTVEVVGMHSPPFREFTDADRAAMARAIRAADPDVVWVGLGTPKQDIEAVRLSTDLGVTTVAVGAAFDFAAGAKPQAPGVLRRLGLEWAHRLWSEPARLWRRYLLGNSYFLALAALEAIGLPAGRFSRRSG